MKRIVDVLTKIASMLFQGGLFGGKVTPQGSFVQFIFMVILALFVLSRFQAHVFNCSQLPMDIVSTSNWEIANSTLPAEVIWERTLTQRDSLLVASSDGVVFNRGSDSSGCSGGRVIALDASSGDVKWVFPADLIRNVTSIPGGYLLSKCCTSVILLDTNRSEIWESETLASKTFNPKFVLADDNAYFIEDSDTYELSLDDGSLERISQGSQTEEAFWLRQLIFPVVHPIIGYFTQMMR